MRRNYEADFVVKVLQKVQKEVPEVSLTADVIVGFPQEGEENFSNTLKNLELIGFSDLHVFPYSDREKTTAAMLDGKIDPQIKKQRVKMVEELNNRKYAWKQTENLHRGDYRRYSLRLYRKLHKSLYEAEKRK